MRTLQECIYDFEKVWSPNKIDGKQLIDDKNDTFISYRHEFINKQEGQGYTDQLVILFGVGDRVLLSWGTDPEFDGLRDVEYFANFYKKRENQVRNSIYAARDAQENDIKAKLGWK